uniref:Multifunctional methyltransferase subunit TRM112 homolog B (Trinotate prediction) n=1 Tax=Myxobolus squamalis TaxID=59785 RepID=A0A6B2G977_MYXSQ
MRLLLHNVLKSNSLGSKIGYPLGLECSQSRIVESDFHLQLLKNMYQKIDYKVLYDASRIVGYNELPEFPPDSLFEDEAFGKIFHHAIMEIDVVEGFLICPDTGYRYVIHESIPDMIIPHKL